MICKPSMRKQFDDAFALDDDIKLDDDGEPFEARNKDVILMKPKKWINVYFIKNRVIAFIFQSIHIYYQRE